MKKDKTFFREVLGTTPKTKILELFIEGESLEYTMLDIIRATYTGSVSAYSSVKDFLDLGILIKTRRIGKAQLYKLNKNNPIVKELVKLFEWVIRKGNDKYLDENSTKIKNGNK